VCQWGWPNSWENDFREHLPWHRKQSYSSV